MQLVESQNIEFINDYLEDCRPFRNLFLDVDKKILYRPTI